MYSAGYNGKASQRGAILPLVLIVLVGATLIALAFVRSNILSLRIGGASVMVQQTESAAESLLANFFSLNPLTGAASTRARYRQGTPTCSTDAAIVGNSNPDVANSVFDCRTPSLPSNTQVDTLAVVRAGCAEAPRSSLATQAGAPFNYFAVNAAASNTLFGSRGEVSTGIAQLIVICP